MCLCICRGKYVTSYKSSSIVITDEKYREVFRPMVRQHQSFDVGLVLLGSGKQMPAMYMMSLKTIFAMNSFKLLLS